MRVLTETQKTRASFGKNTDVRVAAELLLMQLCEPSLRLDAQALDARISRVEEQLASGVLVKAAPPSRTMLTIQNAEVWNLCPHRSRRSRLLHRSPRHPQASGLRCLKSCARRFLLRSAVFLL